MLTAIKYAVRSLDALEHKIHGKTRETIHLLDELDEAGILFLDKP